MKLRNLGTAAFLIAAIAIAVKYMPAWSQQNQVKQLLESRQCRGCNLTNVNLKGADLQGVNLEGANLEGAELQGAKLGNASLKGANLKAANFQGADLGCTGIVFDFKANEKEATMNFNVGAVPRNHSYENSILGFNMKANDQGASMNLNLFGCANFEGANLEEAKMPDGNIHP